jgi:hypothetical protein
LVDARNEVAAILDRTTLASALEASPEVQLAEAILGDGSAVAIG